MSHDGRIGITGARGTLGRILQAQLNDAGSAFSTFDGDICSSADLRKWTGSERLTHVFHLAAIVPVDVVEREPARACAVNVGGTAQVLDALTRSGQRPWFFYASSSHVYAPSTAPLAEDAPLAPSTLYGQTKRMGEQVVEACAPRSGMPYCVGRIFSFYDDSQRGTFLLPSMRARLKEAKEGEPFNVHGADDVRDLSRADEIVATLVRIMRAALVGVFNVGSGHGTRIADFVRGIAGRPLDVVNVAERPATTLVADVAKLRASLS